MFSEDKQTEGQYDNFFVQAIDGYYDAKPKAQEAVLKPWKAFSKKYSINQALRNKEKNLTKNEDCDLELDFLKKLDFNYDLEDTNDSNSFSTESETCHSETLSIKDNLMSRTSFNEENLKVENTERPKFTSFLKTNNFKEEVKNYKINSETKYSFNMKRMLALQVMTQVNLTKKLVENMKKLQN